MRPDPFDRVQLEALASVGGEDAPSPPIHFLSSVRIRTVIVGSAMPARQSLPAGLQWISARFSPPSVRAMTATTVPSYVRQLTEPRDGGRERRGLQIRDS